MVDLHLLLFWLIAALAAWTQTLTGFALGLIVMGTTGALGLMPVPQAAAVTSLLVILNGTLVVAQSGRDIAPRIFGWLALGAFPGLAAGYLLLGWLAGQAVAVLQLCLGVAVLGASVQLARQPRGRTTLSPPAGFVAAGVAGGLMGGLFATSGPPVIWQLYRQPLSLAQVRATLITLFLTTQIFRLGLVTATGGMTRAALVAAAGAAPAVLAGTWIARRFPPPVAPLTIRRAALGLLALSGLAMIQAGLR